MAWASFPLAVFLAFALQMGAYAEETFETLNVGTNALKNARIIQASPVDLLIGHDDGYKRVKLQDLPDSLKESATRFKTLERSAAL